MALYELVKAAQARNRDLAAYREGRLSFTVEYHPSYQPILKKDFHAVQIRGQVIWKGDDALWIYRARDPDGFTRFALPRRLAKYVVEKGSIALDGVSLTVAEVTDAAFGVALIPTTLEATTLGAASPGDHVNVEVDVVAKYVEKLAGAYLIEAREHNGDVAGAEERA
jgi:riboflavin synthase